MKNPFHPENFQLCQCLSGNLAYCVLAFRCCDNPLAKMEIAPIKFATRSPSCVLWKLHFVCGTVCVISYIIPSNCAAFVPSKCWILFRVKGKLLQFRIEKNVVFHIIFLKSGAVFKNQYISIG